MAERQHYAVKSQRHQSSEYTVGMTTLCGEVTTPSTVRRCRRDDNTGRRSHTASGDTSGVRKNIPGEGMFPNGGELSDKLSGRPSFGTNQVFRRATTAIVKEGTECWPSARRDDEMRRRREV